MGYKCNMYSWINLKLIYLFETGGTNHLENNEVCVQHSTGRVGLIGGQSKLYAGYGHVPFMNEMGPQGQEQDR